MLDEVQSGCGRTGKFFSYEHFGIKPDITCLAKGLGGGVPIGATIAKEEVATFSYMEHGSTVGGNPLAAAAANATLSTIQSEKLLSKVTQDGAYMISKLNETLSSKKQVREIRGMGLMLAVEFKIPSKDIITSLSKNGVLCLPAGEQVLRMLPPFVISKSSIDEVVEKIAQIAT